MAKASNSRELSLVDTLDPDEADEEVKRQWPPGELAAIEEPAHLFLIWVQVIYLLLDRYANNYLIVQ
ncbi:hypothetical protein EYZ11_012877 [Aspergillus tanneri]|uniref:Uncharacterized protein n=1 Tax=Aspergillus tanneri TaxID=1220188 RepID=A0A4S3IZ41_9EURO|nr:hypothetical protein EYZ11_012877 [Aspergillus tanneri]